MEQAEIVKRICHLLGIESKQYYELMYETGEDYFAWQCKGFDDVLQSFRSSREMWNWWKQQYYLIDEHIIRSRAADLAADGGRKMYRTHHLGIEYYPNEAIVDKAMRDYESIVQDIIRQAHARV